MNLCLATQSIPTLPLRSLLNLPLMWKWDYYNVLDHTCWAPWTKLFFQCVLFIKEWLALFVLYIPWNSRCIWYHYVLSIIPSRQLQHRRGVLPCQLPPWCQSLHPLTIPQLPRPLRWMRVYLICVIAIFFPTDKVELKLLYSMLT